MAALVRVLRASNHALYAGGEPRRRILKACEASGWLAAGTLFDVAIANIETAKKVRLVFLNLG